jgi:hypothetical protein
MTMPLPPELEFKFAGLVKLFPAVFCFNIVTWSGQKKIAEPVVPASWCSNRCIFSLIHDLEKLSFRDPIDDNNTPTIKGMIKADNTIMALL